MRAINTFLDTNNTEFEISYSKWLRELFSEIRVEEINEMERDFFKSLTESSRIVTLKRLNNSNYQSPLQGA